MVVDVSFVTFDIQADLVTTTALPAEVQKHIPAAFQEAIQNAIAIALGGIRNDLDELKTSVEDIKATMVSKVDLQIFTKNTRHVRHARHMSHPN